jgi:hypothetical protein
MLARGTAMDLILGLLFSSIGTGYLIYGKRQHNGIFAITGVLLIVYPYLLSNPFAILIVGVAIASAPFVLERWG